MKIQDKDGKKYNIITWILQLITLLVIIFFALRSDGFELRDAESELEANSKKFIIDEKDPTVNPLGKATLSCISGQIPKWNGSIWECANDGGVDTVLNESQVDSYVSNNGYLTSETDPTVSGAIITHSSDINAHHSEEHLLSSHSGMENCSTDSDILVYRASSGGYVCEEKPTFVGSSSGLQEIVTDLKTEQDIIVFTVVSTSGEVGPIYYERGRTITGWVLACDAVGSLSIDLWVDSLENAPPTISDSIVGSYPISINNSLIGSSSTLSGWTTHIANKSVGKMLIGGSSTISWCNLNINVIKD